VKKKPRPRPPQGGGANYRKHHGPWGLTEKTNLGPKPRGVGPPVPLGGVGAGGGRGPPFPWGFQGSGVFFNHLYYSGTASKGGGGGGGGPTVSFANFDPQRKTPPLGAVHQQGAYHWGGGGGFPPAGRPNGGDQVRGGFFFRVFYFPDSSFFFGGGGGGAVSCPETGVCDRPKQPFRFRRGEIKKKLGGGGGAVVFSGPLRSKGGKIFFGVLGPMCCI